MTMPDSDSPEVFLQGQTRIKCFTDCQRYSQTDRSYLISMQVFIELKVSSYMGALVEELIFVSYILQCH